MLVGIPYSIVVNVVSEASVVESWTLEEGMVSNGRGEDVDGLVVYIDR